MFNPFETSDEKIIKAILKTPEMRKHLSQEEIGDFNDYSESLLTKSDNPYLKALYALTSGKLDGRTEEQTLKQIIKILKG